MRSHSPALSSCEADKQPAVTQQLNDGVRMLQSQAHNKNGVIELCHTSCVRLTRVKGSLRTRH